MKKIPFLLIFISGIIALSSSCNNQKDTMDTAEPDVTIIDKAEGMKDFQNGDLREITIKEGFRPAGDSAPCTIEKVEVIQDVLHVRVSYSGGCEEHGFEMTTNKMYMKSMPPQLVLFLEHDANGDKCRALLNKDLYFNLTEVRYPGSDKLMLRINDLKIEPIMYDYTR